jgi:DUF4097 and DUF4098 domain-containing protein YvlB
LSLGVAGVIVILAALASIPVAVIAIAQHVAVGIGALGAALLAIGLGILFIKGAIALAVVSLNGLATLFSGKTTPPKPTTSKLQKSWWVFFFAFIISGIVLLALGWGLGARGNLIYIDRNGVHVSDQASTTTTTDSQTNLAAFTHVEISSVSANIELIPSDAFGFETKLSSNNNHMTWDINDGQLTIDAERNHSQRFNLFSFNFRSWNADHHIKVFYPEGTNFNKISLKSVSGDIKALNLPAIMLSARTTSGEIKLSGVIPYVTIIEANSVSGNIDASNFAWPQLSAETISGNINISGVAGAKTSAKSVAGDVRMQLSGKLADYAYDLSSISGDIRINNQRSSSPARSSNQADSQITGHTTSGNLRLNIEP